MKKLLLSFYVILFIIPTNTVAQETALYQFLKSQKEIVSVKKLETDKGFQETYLVMIKQALDYKNPTAGTFQQRFFLSHKSAEAPMVFITDGYTAIKANRKNYISELCPIVGGNQVDIEHRYFAASMPTNPIDYQYLTVENAAHDHHKINQLLKRFYTGKYIATGISKGGQTATFYSYYYPNDVDVTLAYVAPLNFGIEDGRHEPYIKNIVGTKEQRDNIRQFQLECFKRKNELMPLLKEFVAKKGYKFHFPLKEAFDLTVLEYSFAIWQWGTYVNKIPDPEADNKVIFDHLMRVSNVNYVSYTAMANIKSFFVQAAHELGYYGYDTKPFKQYLSKKNYKKYLTKMFIPEVKVNYNKKTMKKIHQYLQNTNKSIIWIYGHDDPWTASGVQIPEKENLLKIVKPNGFHNTRIRNLNDRQKTQIYEKLEQCLKMKMNRIY